MQPRPTWNAMDLDGGGRGGGGLGESVRELGWCGGGFLVCMLEEGRKPKGKRQKDSELDI